MAADLDERIESVDVSEVELDGKIGKDLSVGGGGDCNGNAHKQEGKDDGDGSYVFVNGSDMVADDPVVKDLDVTDREVVELGENVNSPIEEKPVEVNKSNVNGEGSKIDESEVEMNDAKLESHAIENGNQEPLISSVEAEAVESEPCQAANPTVVVEAAESKLEEGDQECLITPAEVESELSGSGNEQLVEEDHKLDASLETEGQEAEITVAGVAAESNLEEGDQECLIPPASVESELSGSGNEQLVDHKLEAGLETEGQEAEVTVAGVAAESNFEEEDQECLIPPASVESELSGSGNEQVVKEGHKLEAVSETEGRETEVTVACVAAESNLEGGDQECLITHTKAVESELSGSADEQVVEVDHKLEGASETEGQETEVTVAGVAAESNLEGGDQGCLIACTKAVESELSGSGNEPVVEVEHKLEGASEIEGQEAEVTVTGAAVESKLVGGDQESLITCTKAVESELSGSGNEQVVQRKLQAPSETEVTVADEATESKLEDGDQVIRAEAVGSDLSGSGNDQVVEEDQKLEAPSEIEVTFAGEATTDSKLEDGDAEVVESDLSGSCNEKVVEKEKNLEATTELEEQETEIITVAESKLDHLNDEEENVEEQIKSNLDSDVKKDLDCSQTEVPDVIVPELNQVDNGEEKAEEQIKSDSITDAKDNLDCSHTEDPDVVVSELNQVANGEEKEEQTISDSAADVKDHLDCSQSEIHVVSEIHELDNGDDNRKEQLNSDCSQSEVPDGVSGVQQPDNEEKKTEEASNADVAEDPQLAVEEVSEVEHVQVNDADEKAEEQKKSDSSAEDQVDQDSHMTVTESVVTELQGETVRLGNGVPTDEPSEPLEADQKLNEEIVTCSSDDMQVEAEDSNAKSESIESLPACPVGQSISETELNNAVEGGESITFPVEETVSETEVNNSAGEVKSMLTCPKDEIQTEPKNDIESVGTESLAPSAADMKSKTELEAGSIEIGESLPVDHAESTILRSVSSGRWADMCADDNVDSEGVNGANEKDHRVPDIPIEEVGIESEANLDAGPVDVQLDIPVDDVKIESDSANGCGNLDNGLVDDVQLEPEAGTRSVAIKEEMSNANVNIRSMPAIVSEVIDVANEEVQQISADNGTPIHEEVVAVEGIESNGSILASPEDSTTDALESQKVEDEVVRRPIRFLIRIPRYVDDTIRDQIGLAQQQVEERTQSRDAIRSTIQSRKVTCSEYRDKFEATKLEERAAREILNAKRQEMDSIQVVINRMKSANSIDDIDDKVHNMEHRIQHETMPLKEEKQLIRDMKQLKTLREQISSSLSREAEGQPTSDQRDTVEERFKLLKQELESARNVVLRAEAITKASRKIYFDESDKLRELQGQFRAADDLRQEAYMRLHNLKKQLYEKNKYFRTYKDDAKKAEDYAFAGNREALQNLCANQVEMVMELWNKNDEFRNEYVRCNKMSILRRFKTLDGRSLGPDEEPPVLLRSPQDERFNNNRGSTTANKIISTSVVPNSEQGKSDFPALEPVTSVQKSPKGNVKSVVNLEQKTQPAKSKETKSVVLENGSATVSGREEIEEKAKEEIKLRKEEEEVARKAEELRKEEEAAKLKEQRRLEEKAKAKEAEERKKRNAEKAQARALLKAQKEAELKEKEREKKARKKEKKQKTKAAAAESPTGGVETESASSSEINPAETARELEMKEKPKTVAKRALKASVLAKQTKLKAAALPPPLRNRGKRRMQQWMWVAVAILVVLGLFLLGNNYSSKFGLPRFGF